MTTAIQCLASTADDATRLGARLGVPVHRIAQHRFPDGEIAVTVGPAAATTILYLPLDQPNDKLLTILFAAEALRRDGCSRLVLLAPYLCYMRQDIAFHPGEAISQRAVGRLLAGLVDRVITVDAHLHRTATLGEVFPGIVANDLSAMPVIAAALCQSRLAPTTIVVGPDSESQPWVDTLAGLIGAHSAVARKIRHGDRSVEIAFDDPARIAGRPALLIDDIVSSGGTLIACAQALLAAGATSVDAVITHALFPPKMLPEFTAAGISSIRSAHTVPHPTNAIVLDDLFAEALRDEVGAAPPEALT
ncbi:ribose-phosphate pyrophosphokinase [Rhodopseudomonas pseudopalustris]|uniref:Ribose-phosphate pyrophosphokinase n=1 Tax=Rhodopseudomonas pseudopalustris TaxID=1513892 RepID=A0A1H8P9D1_9BRAD|nr:ribose-phosphate pyrophosphokinase [Rhodopseudomonas pseudopalustris]SEO38387.1 ribose-phosphate pyrophosphokinase [Rhodopseudomonas pseudopalustris]